MRHRNLAIGVIAVVAFSLAGWLIGTGPSGFSTTQTRLPVVAGEVAYAIPELRTAERVTPDAVATPPTLPSAAVAGATATADGSAGAGDDPAGEGAGAVAADEDEPALVIVEGRPSYLDPVAYTSADVAAIDIDFLASLNELRADVGVAEVERDESLDALASAWTETMSVEGELRHSEMIYDLVAETWVAAGENIAFGPGTVGIMTGFDESPEHRANMINPAYGRVGIGTVVIDGVIWTTHLFAG